MHLTRIVFAGLLLGCGHSSPFEIPVIPPLGASGTTGTVQLTFNGGQDYWPSWTEDGAGILYAYSQPGRSDDDRCIGLLPAAGGTRLWSLCDDRVGQADSSNSFAGAALGRDGRLLYLEAVARKGREVPDRITFWLADSAAPFNRRALIRFPIFLGGTSVNWLADVSWTGQNEFIALAQTYTPEPHCRFCALSDSTFYGVAIVRGTITSGGATLQPVTGTNGAALFAVVPQNGTIVFVPRGTLALLQVPPSGGVATYLATIPSAANQQILGLDCNIGVCIVATSRVVLHPALIGFDVPVAPLPAGTLWRVARTTGQVTQIRNGAATDLWASIRFAPDNLSVVLQAGGSNGTLELTSTPGSNLFLLRDIGS